MYYLVINGASQGPLAEDKIRAMLASGEITSETMAWKEGQAEWLPLSRVLAPAGGTAVPPPAPAVPAVPVATGGRRGCFSFAGGVGVTLAVLGGLFLLFVAVVGGLIGYGVYTGMHLDKSSKAYVDEAVPAIVTNWSQEELKKRASPAMLKASSDEDLAKMFTVCRRLGALKSYDGCEGASRVNFTSEGKTITATYIAHAKFENGDAEIKVLLIQLDGQWKILGFHVDSSALIKQ